jgi:hypothetical protein
MPGSAKYSTITVFGVIHRTNLPSRIELLIALFIVANYVTHAAIIAHGSGWIGILMLIIEQSPVTVGWAGLSQRGRFEAQSAAVRG